MKSSHLRFFLFVIFKFLFTFQFCSDKSRKISGGRGGRPAVARAETLATPGRPSEISAMEVQGVALSIREAPTALSSEESRIDAILAPLSSRAGNNTLSSSNGSTAYDSAPMENDRSRQSGNSCA
jgi:hypothetical protein